MKIEIINGNLSIYDAYSKERKNYLFINEAGTMNGDYRNRQLGFSFKNDSFCLSMDEVKHLIVYLENWIK